MARILIVDSDQEFLGTLKDLLDINNYQLFEAYAGQQAIEFLDDGLIVDIMVCDCTLADMTAIDLLKVLQASHRHLPVVILSTDNEVRHAVEAMRWGAKDFILKATVDDVMTDTIEHVLEQHRKTIQTLLKFESIVKQFLDRGVFDNFTSQFAENLFFLDITNNRVYFDARPLELTQTEFDILLCLWRARNRVVRYEQIILFVHNDIVQPDEAKRALSAHISNLRRKLDEVGCEDAILTQRARGYYLNPKYL